MTVYRNINWTRRNPDCTNVVFCVTDGQPMNYNGTGLGADHWRPVPARVADSVLRGFEEIGSVMANGSRATFYGYL